jgi:chaperonin GroEL
VRLSRKAIVPGGGVSLLRARVALENLKGGNDEQNAGIKIVSRSKSRYVQFVSNAGAEPSVVLNKVVEGKGNFGFNAQTVTYGLVEMGVVDPAKVTRSALQNAASVAGLHSHHRLRRGRAGGGKALGRGRDATHGWNGHVAG